MGVLRRLKDQDPERGAGTITIMVAGLLVALVALAGLVVDGGAKWRAIEHANSAAQHAARTATQQIDSSGVLAGRGVSLDAIAAVQAGNAALAAEGVSGSVNVQGDEVLVTTTATSPTLMLSIVGIHEVSGEGRATARILTEDPEVAAP
ncbi:pilus assembly protein TadG-related protein [Pseudactinotalea sp. Z1748]|uniref:pilus assembly protein TadG-related protein n=1 Tax=Pseudactinotalea sp. Z1748 TaxID=3413027 RepID=UPI003C7CAC60